MGRKRGRFADVIGLAPRNVAAFMLFVLSVLGLFMAALVLVAYAGVRVGFLSAVWVEWPGDAVKVVAGILLFLTFLWLRVFRRAKKAEPGEKEAGEGELEEADVEEAEPQETDVEEGELEVASL